ncbi:RidA family protein [Streptomyces sp. S.PB5]|uniref:RidA family protein n=1 Tax=Streptomyces sp. S.PB5 TaxID=3020844 RepID=UPI0025B02292|nr:RidA family protein [Streptomyces sp. S.PB5]MDN3029009.1 RidA family protein [Streptomyces sp. S.PB5]
MLASADMSVDNIVRLTSYLRDPAYAAALAAARTAALGDRRVPTTAIVVSTLDSNWLVENEVIAAAWHPHAHLRISREPRGAAESVDTAAVLLPTISVEGTPNTAAPGPFGPCRRSGVLASLTRRSRLHA